VILADWEIQNACHDGLVVPFTEELLNPASLDVRLGAELLIESAQSSDLVTYPLRFHTQAEPYLLKPGQFVLAQTIEVFNLPDTIAAEFRLKSSRAREGLDQALAVWADPGWHGSVLTMELRNNRQLHPIPLWYGMRIGQMVFHRMSARPKQSYAKTGRYNGHRTVVGSLG
jgi:dCTP deaminase